eukprot:jgi/Botrbrau1/109/Bobra.0022s0098.1
MSVGMACKASQVFGRGGKFVDDSVDTSSFVFKPGNDSIQGPPSLPDDEERRRLETLFTLVKISDTEDPVVASMCKLVRSVFGVPVAGVSIVDEDRCWVRTPDGISVYPRNVSLCSYHIANKEPTIMVIEDLTQDPRSQKLPHVVQEPGAKFYASAPLIASNGSCLGAMCVLDLRPRRMSEEHLAMLAGMAECMVRQLEKDNLVYLQRKRIKNLARSLDLVASPLMVLDASKPEWVIRLVNSCLADLTGYHPSELTDQPFWEKFKATATSLDEAKASWQEHVEEEAHFSLQVRSLRGGSAAEAFILCMRPVSEGQLDEYAIPISVPSPTGKAVETLPPGLYFGTIPETVRDMPIDFAGCTATSTESGSHTVPLSSGNSTSSTSQMEIEEKLHPWPEQEPQKVVMEAKQGCQCAIM